MKHCRRVPIDDLSGSNWSAYGLSGKGVGQFVCPSYVTVDSAGKIYVSDGPARRIVIIDDMSGTNWITIP